MCSPKHWANSLRCDSVSRNEIVHGSTIADVGIDADGKTLLIDYTSNGVRYRAVFIANER